MGVFSGRRRPLFGVPLAFCGDFRLVGDPQGGSGGGVSGALAFLFLGLLREETLGDFL
jgi:hypothetical protein